MIVLVSIFGKIKARSPFVRVVVSMTLKIRNNNYSKTPPEVVVSKVFLMVL